MSLLKRLGNKFDKSRFIAFLFHFGISLALIAAVFTAIYLVWFPHALASASGGLEGLAIVAAVDIVLGPVLTFVIYDIAKSRLQLTRDIGVIAFLQLAGLIVGVFVVYEARPIAIVHVYDTFHVLGQSDFDAANIDTSSLDKFPGNYPKILYIDTEKNLIAFLSKKVLDELNDLPPLHLRLDLYQNMPRDSTQIANILQKTKMTDHSNCSVQDIKSAYTSGNICFHADTFIFTDFVKGESVSFSDDVNIKIEVKPG